MKERSIRDVGVRTQHYTGYVLFFIILLNQKKTAVADKVRNVCHLQLSNNVWLPTTDSRPRSRAAGTPRDQVNCHVCHVFNKEFTYLLTYLEHDVNVWQLGLIVIWVLASKLMATCQLLAANILRTNDTER